MHRVGAPQVNQRGTTRSSPAARVGITTLLAFALSALPTACGSGGGDASSGNGGSTSGGAKAGQTGATTASTGGAPIGTGGAGGAPTNTGGSPTSTGGSTTGGSAAGGSLAGTGGVKTGTGGTGGNAGTGGPATGGAPASGGSPASGGTTAAGGATGGSTAVTGPPIEIIAGGPTPKAGDLWVSPSGSDSNPGTEGSPLKTLGSAIEKAVAGQTIWMTTGTHSYSDMIQIPKKKAGTASQPFRLAGVPGNPRPIIDFSGETRSSEIRGLQVDGHYWHIRYLEIKSASDNGVHVTGSNNVLELLEVHDCGDTGVQLSDTSSQVPANNLILNCDSYENADTSAENADGFAAKLGIGPGNRFKGCRAWYNVDDNWDHYEAGNEAVVLEGCWSFAARHPTKSKPNSDGNGFKMGGQRRLEWYTNVTTPTSIAYNASIGQKYPTYDVYVAAMTAPHKLINCFAFNNPSAGFDRNNNPSTEITCTNCGAWGNQVQVEDGITVIGELISLPTVTTEKAIAAKRDANGDLPDIRTLQ